VKLGRQPTLDSDCNPSEKRPKTAAGSRNNLAEEVLTDMITKKSRPTLRRWVSPAYHVLRHRGLANIHAEFQEFTVDSRRTPENILYAHALDKAADLWLNCRTSRPTPPSLSQHIMPEATLAPALYRLRLHDLQSFRPSGPDRCQGDPEQPICIRKLGSLCGTLQNGNLMPKRHVLKSQISSLAKRG